MLEGVSRCRKRTSLTRTGLTNEAFSILRKRQFFMLSCLPVSSSESTSHQSRDQIQAPAVAPCRAPQIMAVCLDGLKSRRLILPWRNLSQCGVLLQDDELSPGAGPHVEFHSGSECQTTLLFNKTTVSKMETCLNP